jgi:hypothetical protein
MPELQLGCSLCGRWPRSAADRDEFKRELFPDGGACIVCPECQRAILRGATTDTRPLIPRALPRQLSFDDPDLTEAA